MKAATIPAASMPRPASNWIRIRAPSRGCDIDQCPGSTRLRRHLLLHLNDWSFRGKQRARQFHEGRQSQSGENLGGCHFLA